MNLPQYHIKQLGSTLIEVLIAVTITALALTAVVSALVPTIKTQRISSQQQLATKYANEGSEWTRRERDRLGWGSFYDAITTIGGSTATLCLTNSLTQKIDGTGEAISGPTGSPTPVCPSQAVTNFQRKIVLTQNGANEINVQLTISWQEGSIQFSPVYTLKLHNWDTQ